MAAAVIIIFLVTAFIFGFTQLGENPEGALIGILISGGILAYIIYCVIKENAVGSVTDFRRQKDLIAFNNERREIEKRYTKNGFGDRDAKTGIFSEGYKQAIEAFNEKHGMPGTDTYIATKAKEVAWSQGIWNKAQLDAIGKMAVRHHRAQIEAKKAVVKPEQIREVPKDYYNNYKKPPSDIF